MTEIEKKCLELINYAISKNSSDIHFQPKKDGVHIQFRILGSIKSFEQINEQLYNRMLSYFKFQANMDIGEKRRPQNGSLILVILGKAVSIRLSTIPTPYNESLVLRLLPEESNIEFKDLFLFPTTARPLLTYIQDEAGLIIMTGPTGSGKSTTIYALLQTAAKTFNRRVLTIEDPIEKLNDAFTQIEVNEKAGITFAEGFKASLRQDPDIILVGEIRDSETAKIAIKAALSGHLIVTTMHAKNTVGALYRLLEFGIPLSDIQQTITAIATQKLINIVCEHCGDYCHIDSHGKRRLALIELLSQQALTDTMDDLQKDRNPSQVVPSLQDEINKAIEYGYLLESNKGMWIDANVE